MQRLPLSWKLFIILMALMLVCVIAVGEFASSSLSNFYLRSQEESLISIAKLASGQISDFTDISSSTVNARELAELAEARITIILQDGRVVGDSEEDPERMENHAQRPEVAAALQGQIFPSMRFSDTVKMNMLYVATPIIQGHAIVAVVRVARPLIEIERKQAKIRRTLWRSCALATVIAALLSVFLAQRISRPIRTIRRAAERYAKGDYSKRLYLQGPPEYANLARSMNTMAEEIEQRLRQINRQRKESESILASMEEGVLAIDQDDRILMLNASAQAMFDIEGQARIGELVQEGFRHIGLQRLLEKIRTGQSLSAEEILLEGKDGKVLQAESVPLRDENGVERGLLFVFSDMTRLHRLENMRREFVSNVSHELRTPITSIKGFIETLREGAIHDSESSERFLEIIDRQADRLNAIIVDLLSLSRLEQGKERASIPLEPHNLREMLQTTIQHFQPQCAEKDLRIELQCEQDIRIESNPQLFEQAVGNLLDNAINYSPAGKIIRVDVERRNDTILIHVRDEGCGIAAEHLPRLFERFYRVDTGRSRQMGGTGLGLAIVKHILQLHGGMVRVESKVGEGSVFTLEIPEVNPPR